MRLRSTQHAADRWRERATTRGFAEAMSSSVQVPYRFAVTRYGAGVRRSKGHSRYRVTASSVLVCQGRVVVTVLPLAHDGLADVLVWLMTGLWLG